MRHLRLTSVFIRDMQKGFSITWNAGKRYAVYNLLLSVATAVLPLAVLWYIKNIIDIITRHEQVTSERLIYTVAILVAIQLVQAAMQHMQSNIQTIQQQLSIDYLTRKVLQKAVDVEYSYYENAAYYNTLHQAQQEVIHKTGLIITGFNLVLQNGLSLIFLSALFLQFNWIYGVMVIVAGLPVLYIKWKHTRDGQGLERKNVVHERRAAYYNRVLTDATHAKEVRTYYFGGFFIDKFNDLRKTIFEGKKQLSANQARSETLIQAIEIIMLAAIVLDLGLQTLDGGITPGIFIFYFQALQRLQSGFRNFLNGITTLLKMSFFLKNLYAFLDLNIRRNEKSVAQFPMRLGEGIELKNVRFRYAGSDKPALDQVSMHFVPGRVTAIIGENGSGKSTIVKLLSRLYEPTGGQIIINGMDIARIHPAQYAAHVSTLFQDYNQYHFSLADNIMLGQHRDKEKLRYAADESGLADIIKGLPGGFDTTLGKMFGDDVELSGGQWQKIAIARMLYRQSPVMILDEPTSNIDPLAEHDILKKIAGEKNDRIIILITHRLHNLRFADYVYLMEQGKINGEGSVDALFTGNSLFREMYQRQELLKARVGP